MLPEKHGVPAKQPGLKMVAGPVLSPSEQHVQAGLMAEMICINKFGPCHAIFFMCVTESESADRNQRRHFSFCR